MTANPGFPGLPCTLEYHAKLSGRFCPDCGQPAAPVGREPGEIKAMLQRVKQQAPPRDPRGMLTFVLVTLVVSSALKWALGEITDENLLGFFKDHSDKLPPPEAGHE